jgi:hypothetical protein
MSNADRQAAARAQFVERANKIHNGKYDYSLVDYKTARVKVKIVCPLHGEFEQTPDTHLRKRVGYKEGSGCPGCRGSAISNSKRLDLNIQVETSRSIHGDRYDYSKASPVNARTLTTIICPDHGEFQQSFDNHIRGTNGCPRCSHNYSAPQKEIEAHLTTLGIPFEANTRSVIPPKELDIWIPEHNLAIEFNGIYWHSLDGNAPATDKLKHRDKFLACQEKGIQLLQIDEHDWGNPVRQQIWKSIVASRLGRHERRVFARKCAFQEITNTEANTFLDANHLQGSTPSTRFCYGLFLEVELVGVITFSFHEKTQLNLTRLAFPVGTTVVGGANKLFRNALKALPKDRDIVTFSNNQYSNGDVYRTLGFSKDLDLPSSYQWWYKRQIINKRQCRHSRLPALLGGLYDPNLTEHENMYRAGARCLYDAGYQRWVIPGKITQ